LTKLLTSGFVYQ